jgi:hypothetical protein
MNEVVEKKGEEIEAVTVESLDSIIYYSTSIIRWI